MNPELAEYLAIVELKLQAVMQDIKNIKERLSEKKPTKKPAHSAASASSSPPTFFDACTADDPPRELTKYEQCPHN